jgi:hypothetical protein
MDSYGRRKVTVVAASLDSHGDGCVRCWLRSRQRTPKTTSLKRHAGRSSPRIEGRKAQVLCFTEEQWCEETPCHFQSTCDTLVARKGATVRSLGLPELIVILFVCCFFVWPIWRMVSKMGYPGVLSLTLLVPVVNLGVYFFLAFSEWPVLKELAALRQRHTPAAVPSSSSLFCTKCGAAVPSNAAFCAGCGSAQPR